MAELVGILNITPDSFSDGNLFLDPERAVKHAEQLFADGAAIVDIGAESTRPGAIPITAKEEWHRLWQVLDWFQELYPGRLSLDTYHPETAAQALALRPFIINDVTGFQDEVMVKLAADHQVKVIVNHIPGKDIQAVHKAEPVDDLQQVVDDLLSRAATLESKGIKHRNIILDPGIGFGKTVDLNWQLLEFAQYVPDYKVMIGYSRKRFLGDKRMDLKTNLAAGKAAIEAGAAYLRVHDVRGHRQLVEP